MEQSIWNSCFKWILWLYYNFNLILFLYIFCLKLHSSIYVALRILIEFFIYSHSISNDTLIQLLSFFHNIQLTLHIWVDLGSSKTFTRWNTFERFPELSRMLVFVCKTYCKTYRMFSWCFAYFVTDRMEHSRTYEKHYNSRRFSAANRLENMKTV